VRRETLRNGGKILTDIDERTPTDTTTAGDIVINYFTESVQKLISKLRGRARKRARGEAEVGGKKKRRRKEPIMPRKK